jgi:hypothetical protein
VNGELERIRKKEGRSLTHQVISRQMTGRDEENHDTLRRIYDVTVGIRARYLPHTSTKRRFYANPLGDELRTSLDSYNNRLEFITNLMHNLIYSIIMLHHDPQHVSSIAVLILRITDQERSS